MQGVGDGGHGRDEDHTCTNVLLWREKSWHEPSGVEAIVSPRPHLTPFRAESSSVETLAKPSYTPAHRQTLRRP